MNNNKAIIRKLNNSVFLQWKKDSTSNFWPLWQKLIEKWIFNKFWIFNNLKANTIINNILTK